MKQLTSEKIKISEIYKILTNKEHNRDKPYLENKFEDILCYFINQNKPIKLIGFWGIGPKDKHNWADLTSCEFLKKIDDEVRKIYSIGLEFIFIFAPPHAIHNGISMETIRSYTKDMEKIFNKFHFKYIYLDSLWKKYGINFEKIDMIFKKKPKNWWDKIENSELIEQNAKNRNFRLTPRIAAQKYYIMRNLEKEIFKKEFTECIFHSFSDSKLRNVAPNLPTLYLYARREWPNIPAPWFVLKEK